MSSQQERLNEQIMKTKETLRQLQAKEQELKKREKEKQKKAVNKWFAVINKNMDAVLQECYGINYWERQTAEEIADIVSQFIRGRMGNNNEG